MHTNVAGVPEIIIEQYPDIAATGKPWAGIYGGARCLARYVLDNPQIVNGKRVIDIGCGSGILGIAAIIAGATEVIFVDIDPEALASVHVNAQLNNVNSNTTYVIPDLVEDDVILTAGTGSIPDLIQDIEQRINTANCASYFCEIEAWALGPPFIEIHRAELTHPVSNAVYDAIIYEI